jgi:hypothetical protein
MHKLEVYYGVLDYLTYLWNDEVALRSNRAHTLSDGDEILFGNAATSYSYIEIDGLRYGAGNSTRGEKYCYAYIDHRRPVHIDYIFKIKHQRNRADLPALETTCAIVRPLLQVPDAPEFPWDIQCVFLFITANCKFNHLCCSAADLGTGTWLADVLGDCEVVNILQLSGQLVLCPLPLDEDALWITIPHDHVSPSSPQFVRLPMNIYSQSKKSTFRLTAFWTATASCKLKKYR